MQRRRLVALLTLLVSLVFALTVSLALAVLDGLRLREAHECRALPLAQPNRTATPKPKPKPKPWLPNETMLGTHNSYRERSSILGIEAWQLEQPPLKKQVELGVGCYEFDLHYGALVYHVASLDERSTCRCLLDCIRTLAFSYDALNQTSQKPLIIYLELKDVMDTRPWYGDLKNARAGIEYVAQQLDIVLGERWLKPRELEFMGKVRDVLALGGWPPLSGRFIFVLVGDTRALMEDSSQQQQTHFFYQFYNASLYVEDERFASIAIDDAMDTTTIHWFSERNVLVRTMADERGQFNRTRLALALQSGATCATTDWPLKVYDV
jgi:hypothetical protein